DGDEVDLEDLRVLAVGDVRADNLDVLRGGAGRDAADALQHAEHRLRPLVGDRPRLPRDLTVEEELLTVVAGDRNAHGLRRDARPRQRSASGSPHAFPDGKRFRTLTPSAISAAEGRNYFKNLSSPGAPLNLEGVHNQWPRLAATR